MRGLSHFFYMCLRGNTNRCAFMARNWSILSLPGQEFEGFADSVFDRGQRFGGEASERGINRQLFLQSCDLIAFHVSMPLRVQSRVMDFTDAD
jgi:hypothetical protein